MFRGILLVAGACVAVTAIQVSHAQAQNRTSGYSYKSRTYQENSSYNRMSNSASKAFAPVKSQNNYKKKY